MANELSCVTPTARRSETRGGDPAAPSHYSPLRLTLDFLFAVFLVVEFAFAFGLTLSGSFAIPVSRLHSLNVSFEIFPSTRELGEFSSLGLTLRWHEPSSRPVRLLSGDSGAERLRPQLAVAGLVRR